MSFAHYIVGLLYFVITLGAVVAAATLVVSRRFPSLGGVPRVLALGVLVTVGVIGAHLLPGMLAIMTRLTVAVAGLLMLAAASRLRPVREPSVPPPAEVDSGRASWVLAAVGVGALLLLAAPSILAAAHAPATASDMLGFKLPNIERWIRSGTFWRDDLFLPMQNTGSYPQNGDVMYLAAMLPWNSDAFVRMVDIPYALLSGLSVYAASCELRAPRATGILAGALFMALPVVSTTAFIASMPDTIMFAGFGTGVAFLLRHARTDCRSDLVVAGLGLGLALGTKWYGVSGVPVLVVAWAIWRRIAGRSPRRVGKDAALVIALVALAGGFWFVRNLVEMGNPFYPVRLPALGLHAPVDLEAPVFGPSIADYLGDGSAWRHYLLPAWGSMFGAAGLAMLATTVPVSLAALGAAMSRRFSRVPGAVTVLALTAIALVVVYFVTPYSAQGFHHAPTFAAVNTRWVVPSVLLAAAVTAWVTGKLLRPARVVVELLAVAAVITAAGARLGGSAQELVKVGVALVVVAALVALARQPRRRGPTGIVTVGVFVALIVALGGFVEQRRFAHGRYLGSDPTFDRVLANPSAQRIGLAGNWDDRGLQPTWPMFGSKLQNQVGYVGQVIDGRLYPFGSAQRWKQAIRASGLDLVLVGHAAQIASTADERLWARRSDLVPIARSSRFTLYRVPTSG